MSSSWPETRAKTTESARVEKTFELTTLYKIKVFACLQVIERAFGLLLQRFPRLLLLNQSTLAKKN